MLVLRIWVIWITYFCDLYLWFMIHVTHTHTQGHTDAHKHHKHMRTYVNKPAPNVRTLARWRAAVRFHARMSARGAVAARG